MTVFGVFIVLSFDSSFALSQRTLLCTTVHHLSLHFPREAQRAVCWAEVAGPSRSMRSLVADTGRDRALREQFLPPRPSSCTSPSLALEAVWKGLRPGLVPSVST